MKILRFCFSAILFLLGHQAFNQNQLSKADALLATSVEDNEHAMSVLVEREGKILYHKTIGYSNNEKMTRANNETKFRIGSVTKQFYASAILKLVEEGKMQLDDPLSKYIDDFPRGSEVTIHHLLTHTSGIKSYTDQSDFIEGVTEPIAPKKLITKIKSLGYDFDPGDQWKYNNSGFVLLGYIVQEVSGMSAEEYLIKNIIKPLGLKNTGIYSNKKQYENEALGYAYSGGKVALALDWDMTWAGGAGNMYSTAYDLLLWNRGVFGGKVLNQNSLVKAHSKVQLNDGSFYPYGYGWSIYEYKRQPIIGHSGGLHGFLTNLAHYPEINATIVVLSNCSPPKKVQPGQITEKLANIFFADALEKNVEIAANVLKYDKYVGKYEYPGGAIMTITKENNKLMAQLNGQPQFQIYEKAENVFFWKVVNAEITFHVDNTGKVTHGMHRQNGFENKVPLMQEKKEIEMDISDFDPYVGTYILNGSEVKVWEEEGDFFAQISGQPKFQIYPKSEARFFMKAMPVEVEFDNSASPAPSMTIFQGGQQIKAMRN